MKVSVALCSYNGERFLPEQLDSILAQTRLPDELVVCDDASTDATAAIVGDFATRAPFPVRLEINSRTLGSTLNFSQAISICTGDVIALADQDDVWLPHKLSSIASALAANPEAGFAFSNASMVDEAMRPLGYRLWEAVRFHPRERERFRRGEAFPCLLRAYRVTGATLAFRTGYLDRMLPIPAEWHHDAWIALVISATASCAIVEEPLVRYRQHSGQQLGRPKRGWLVRYRVARAMGPEMHEAEIHRYRTLCDRLKAIPELSDAWRELVRRKLDHLRLRSEMRSPGVWRLPRVARETWRGNYAAFSAGWKSIAHDLLLE